MDKIFINMKVQYKKCQLYIIYNKSISPVTINIIRAHANKFTNVSYKMRYVKTHSTPHCY